ncbi:MAG TPA: hypothetical protein VF426_08470 [Marmoricola sp.]
MENSRVASIVGFLVILLVVGLVVLVSRGGYHGHSKHPSAAVTGPTSGSTASTNPTGRAPQTVPSDLPTLPSGATIPSYTFRMGTLNWRGASHYHRNPYSSEQPYYVRAPHMIAKVNASGVSVVGFQEFEGPQAAYFLRHTGGAWRIIPGRYSHSNRVDTRDAIAYRVKDWRLIGVRYLSILYAHGSRMDIPLAHLASTHGTWEIWVLNTHNPASVRSIGGTPASRAADVRSEAALLRSVVRGNPGDGVFFTGDMNSKVGFHHDFFAAIGKGWSAADPSSRLIDWIVGGPGVRFDQTVVDESTNDRARLYTDHPFVHTSVTLTPALAGR